MGTDIHSVFQRRNKKRKGFSKVERRIFNNLSMRKKNDMRFSVNWETVDSSYEEDRHSALFGWLANVHNGYGFSGSLQSSGVKPISNPRGFPDDIFGGCETIPDEIDGKWMGDHSYSWLLGSEIVKAFENLHELTRYGFITHDNYLKNEFKYFVDEIKRLMDLHGEIRMVFGFDS